MSEILIATNLVTLALLVLVIRSNRLWVRALKDCEQRQFRADRKASREANARIRSENGGW